MGGDDKFKTSSNKPVLERVAGLKLEAVDLKREGMDALLRAASLKVEAARLLQQSGKDTGEVLLQEAAELDEKGENFVGAVVLYIELGDTKNIRRIAPNVLNLIGESDLGMELSKFSKLGEGSKEEAEALTELKMCASRFVKATGILLRALNETLSSIPTDKD